jgi:hypothetical protein
MYVRKLAVKAADGFGESREGLYKSEKMRSTHPALWDWQKSSWVPWEKVI